MEEGNRSNGNFIKKEREEVFSKVVRAGKRTYFFDVKESRSNDLYVTVTESMKRTTNDGRFFYEKHKIFLYREDFESFVDGFSSVLEFVESQPENKKVIRTPKVEKLEESSKIREHNELEEVMAEGYTTIDFEDLDEKH